MSDPSAIRTEVPESVAAAAQSLEGQCDALCADIEKLVEGWSIGVEAKVLRPFAKKLNDLEARHAAEVDVLRERLASLAEEEPQAEWGAVEAYVRQAHAECIEPLLDYLEKHDPLVAVAARYASAVEALLARADELPESIKVPLDAAVLDSGRTDSVAQRGRKSLHRQGRSFRVGRRKLANAFSGMLGRAATPLPYASRDVPASQIARARISRDVLPALSRAQAPVVAALEDRLRRLEQSVWEWTKEGLRLITDEDHPKHHVPAALLLKWPASLRPEDPHFPEPVFVDHLQFRTAAVAAPEAPDMGEAFGLIRLDLRTAGTFLYRGVGVPSVAQHDRELSVQLTRDRVRLSDGLLDLWRDMRTVEEGLLLEIAHQTFFPLEHTYDLIKKQIGEIELEALSLVESAAKAGKKQTAKLATDLQYLLEHSSSIDKLYRDLSGLSAADRALTDPGESTWRSLMKKVAALPQDLQLRSIFGENPKAFRLDLMQVVRQAFERPIQDRLRPAAEPLRKTIARVWSETEQVKDVVSNTFHTAIQHLTSEESQVDMAGRPAAEADADLAVLISSGLGRARDSLDDRYQSVDTDWAQFVSQLHRILTDDWNSAFRTVQSDDFLAKRLLGVQTLVSRRAEKAWGGFTDWTAITAKSTGAVFRLVRRRTADLVRIGQSAVGVKWSTEAERHRALDTVASARALYAKLPLVYRRLFSAEPVIDPGLAENRADDLRSLHQVIDRWRDGRGSGVVVAHAPLGAGRTSFLRLFDLAFKDELKTVRVSLESRVQTESELAAVFAGALYPEEEFEGGFVALEALIQHRTAERSTVVLVDNLEMVLFRSPGGATLLNRLLLFWIRTDDSVVWCAAASTLAWQFAEKTAPDSARLAISMKLATWSAETIQELILKRHRRSGISLAFAEPTEPSPIIKQRLKRAKTKQDAQRILSGEFFDALFKIAGQSPTRALFEWVRAGTFSESGDLLVLDSIQPLSFGYLEQFGNDIAFTMRSFMIHNVLTVEEHARLFRTSQETALMAFETLLSAGLIEALDPVKGAAIEPGVRYRLRRLVLEPVMRSLKERHFVY
ncbi:MAG: hypothetical protein ACI9W4_000388 [Rhodothermales bacterium]|jgi:hypothetical protein